MIVGIAIDAWKLTIFHRRLTEGGYTYTQHPGVSPDTLLLKVAADSPVSLHNLVVAASQEAKRAKNEEG